MARIRTVKPELWTDPEFVECSSNARLLFVAALNFASDYGVLADKPKQLKMQCFPADDVDVDQLVDELVAHGFWLRRRAPDGAKVLVIRTFCDHQKVDRPNLGRWGDPRSWPDNPRPFDDDSASTRRTVVEPSPPEGNGREGNGREGSKDSRASLELVHVDAPAVPSEAGFQRFWQSYPSERRVARGAAERAWAKLKTPERIAAVEMIVQHAEVWRATSQEPKFIPHPATWLNQGRWRDPLPMPAQQRHLTRSNQAVADAIARHVRDA